MQCRPVSIFFFIRQTICSTYWETQVASHHACRCNYLPLCNVFHHNCIQPLHIKHWIISWVFFFLWARDQLFGEGHAERYLKAWGSVMPCVHSGHCWSRSSGGNDRSPWWSSPTPRIGPAATGRSTAMSRTHWWSLNSASATMSSLMVRESNAGIS